MGRGINIFLAGGACIACAATGYSIWIETSELWFAGGWWMASVGCFLDVANQLSK